MKKAPTLTRAELDKHKTVYAVKNGGWIENYLGHGQHYEKRGDGDEAQTVELLPVQAEYYLNSGQIEPIAGETKGHPVDAVDGKPINLGAEERARVQQAPGIGQVGESATEALGQASSTVQPSSESAIEVSEQSTASTVEEPASAETPDQAPEKSSKTRRAGQ